MNTVKYEEYHKEKVRLEKLLAERTCVKNIKDNIWFVNQSDGDTPIKIFVNFSCMGAVEPIVASRYADCIKEAANLATDFKYNGYMIE